MTYNPSIRGKRQRIVAAPHRGGIYRNLVAVPDGLLFLARQERGRADLMKLDLDERKAKTLQEKVDGFVASPDRKTLLLQQGPRWSLCGPDAKKQDRLAADALRVEVDPAQEWPQTLREAWRLQRDFFYDPALHGVDWDAAWTRWSSLLPHVRTRDDLNEDVGGERVACRDPRRHTTVEHRRLAVTDRAQHPPQP